MTKQEQQHLISLLNPPDIKDKIASRVRALNWVESQTPTESVKTSRTDAQHRSWFLWLGMIEHEAENAGITWNQLVGKTHQLKITTEGLHVMGKQLQKALWGTDSTKQLKKVGQIDILVDHFVDLFSKVGLELPPFPSSDEKESTLKNIKIAKSIPYDHNYQEPSI